MVNKEKLLYILLVTCIFSVTWNILVLIWLVQISDLSKKVEAYFRGNTFIVEETVETLVYNIEKSYKIKMPEIELHVSLGERSKTVVTYDNNTIHLYISPRVFKYSEKNLRAYFAHEFGHYVLNHFQNQELHAYSFYGSDKNRKVQAEIEADLFVLEFFEKEDLVWVINDLVWGDEKRDDERNQRLVVLSSFK